MKKSLFRAIDRIELFSCYMLCFGFNLAFDYAKTIPVDSFLLQSFLKQLYDYQMIFMFLLTFIILIFHYQMLSRKKVELHCRILVGDTIHSAVFKYIIECLLILVIPFLLFAILSIGLDIRFINNVFLVCVFLFYIMISAMMVIRFENI
ncbi:MAG: hypothetical protein HUJ71_05350 [Pseudobutyrivibrio sp.]|nr:hypothetical protein [Pseudobutyrivibrio sp.]